MNGNFRLSGFMKKTYEAAQTKTAIITNETWATTILRGFVVAHAFCFMLILIYQRKIRMAILVSTEVTESHVEMFRTELSLFVA